MIVYHPLHASLWVLMVSAASDLCVDRLGAAPGSDVWCRCNRRQELVQSERICVIDGGGRSSLCRWSEEKRRCEGIEGKAIANSNGQTKNIGCPASKGDFAQWSKKFKDRGHHLTVASWNVEWLFDGIADPDPVPAWVGDQEQVSRRIERVGDVLKRIDADIYHFAEIENCAVLSDVAGRLNSSFEPFLIQGTDRFLRQQVGLLSRLPPLQSLRRSNERQSYPMPGSKCGHNVAIESMHAGVSKHLVSTFSPVNGHEIVIIGMHLKALPTEPYSCSQREAQASVIRSIIADALQNGKHVIVLGDFNDLDADVRGSDGQIPTSSVLHMLKDVDGDGKDELWNALEMVPREERYTCWWDRNKDKRYEAGEGSMIDHILISSSLRSYVVNVGIDHGHDPERLSDHWPVWIQFNLSSWVAGDSGHRISTGWRESTANATNGSIHRPHVPIPSSSSTMYLLTLAVCIMGFLLYRHLRQ